MRKKVEDKLKSQDKPNNEMSKEQNNNLMGKDKKKGKKEKSSKDKDEKDKKKTKKASRFAMLVVIVLGVICGVVVGTYFSPKGVDASRYNFDADLLRDDPQEIWLEADGKTPVELGAIKACVLAFDKTFSEERVKVEGKGCVVAMGVTQSINSTTIRMGDKLYNENVSVSSFVKALNRYFVEEDNIDHYGGSINGNIVTWNTTPDNTGADAINTMEKYKAKFGSTMYEYMTYIVSSKTVNWASEVEKTEDGNYTFSLSLDKSKAVVNYVKTMKETGGLSSYPDFIEDPQITVTIDSNYRILKFVSSEKYNVSMTFMNVSSTGNLTNTFYYDQDFVIPKITDNSVV